MKKKAAKPKPKAYSLRDDMRPVTLEVSHAEVIAIAEAHVRVASKIPNAFARWMAENRTATEKDLRIIRDHMHDQIDFHTARSKQLYSLVPD